MSAATYITSERWEDAFILNELGVPDYLYTPTTNRIKWLLLRITYIASHIDAYRRVSRIHKSRRTGSIPTVRHC